MPENRDLLDQAFIRDPRRTAIALGPDKARQLEAYLRLEGMADQLHASLSSAPEAHAAGGGPGMGTVIAGEVGERLGGHVLHALGSWAEPVGAIIGVALERAGHRVQASRQALQGRIGEMLASSDPKVFARGLDAVSRGSTLNALRSLHDRFAPTAARIAGQQAAGW